MYHHPACLNNEGGQASLTWHLLEFLKKVSDVQQRSDGREMTEAEHEEMRLKRIQEKNRRNQRKFRARQRVSSTSDPLTFRSFHFVHPYGSSRPYLTVQLTSMTYSSLLSVHCLKYSVRGLSDKLESSYLLMTRRAELAQQYYLTCPQQMADNCSNRATLKSCQCHAVMMYLCWDMLKGSDTGAGKAGGLRAACEGAEQAGHGPGACQGGVGGTQ